MLFKNSVRTSKRTPHFTITKIKWLIMFKEIIAVYSKNHTKPVNTKFTLNDGQSRWCIYFPFDFKWLVHVIEQRIYFTDVSNSYVVL
jgi:hypothetical protein